MQSPHSALVLVRHLNFHKDPSGKYSHLHVILKERELRNA